MSYSINPNKMNPNTSSPEKGKKKNPTKLIAQFR
jgi:hypothetical protein